jgi:hypothetical protein
MGRKMLMSWMAVASTALLLPTPAVATAPENDCFDVLVMATVVRQTPTVIPECADCIVMRWVMRWPWVIELQVERTIKGKRPPAPLTALTVQHTWVRPHARRWWLRRNNLGVFNVLTPDAGTRLPRCSEASPPARPYIRPAKGQTLADLVREGEERYGRGP